MREKFENLCDWWEGIKNELSRYWTIAKLALLQEKATKDSKVKGMNEHEKEFPAGGVGSDRDAAVSCRAVKMIRHHADVYGADFVVNLRQNRHYRYPPENSTKPT